MTDLFASKSKKRQYPADENLGTASSAETGKNAAVDARKKIKGDIEPLVDRNPSVNPRLGVTVLHEPSDPTAAVVDIVFIHGLTGNSARTWIQQQTGTHWPISLLSCDIPNSRILSFGYDADVVNFWSPVSQNRLGNHGLNLLGGLTRLREKSDTVGRNIIFVAHSLGGLVTQDCLWTSRNHPEKHLRQVSSCTIGILFLGTPHHGADLAAWAKFGTTIAKLFKSANSDIVSVLQRGSEMLARVQDGFHGLLRMRVNEGSEIALTCFFEELPLPAVGKVVDMDSAIIPGYASYGIHANHMDMTKFDGRDDDGYESILGELRRWVKGLKPALHDVPLPTSETFTGPPSSKALKPLFLVPFGRDPRFVDRIQLFKNIDEKIKSHCRISLAGIGGAGKSQIAIEYCYRYQNLHPEKHIFWVHASTRQRLEQAYRDIARRLQLPGWNDPAVNTLQLVSEWFNDDENWLMVLDNADDHDTFFAKPGSTVVPLSDYLPNNLQGLMLITTRDKRVRERLASRHASIIVPLMTFSEAHELFRSQFEPKGCWSNDDSKSLLDALEYIPLAITQAAAFLSQNNCSLAEYLDMFCANDSEIQDLLNEDLGDLRRDSESQSSVIKTWKLSFDLIRKQKPRAAEMLSLMAVLDRQGIPKSLLKSNNTDSNVDIMTALGILQAFSLISPGDNGAGYQMHRLVQLATQKWLEIEGSREKWQEQALLTVAKLFPSGHFETWAVCETFLPQAETVIQYREINKIYLEQFSHLLQNIAYFDMLQGRYEIACTRIIAACEMKKEIFGLEHSSTLMSMDILVFTYKAQGRWDEAEKLAVQVIKTSLRVLKTEHPFTMTSIAHLASIYLDQGRWDEAEKLEVQVLETMLRVLKAEHPDTLSSMANLAATYWNQGRWDEAEKLQVQVLEMKLRVLKAEHPDTLTSMTNLAGTYMSQARWDEAEKLQVQVLETSLRVLKAEYPHTLTSMANLASTYWNQGRWDEAEKLEVQVLETRLRVLKAEHPDTLTSMVNLAATYRNQGRWDEAEKLQVQVLETRLRVLKAEHPDTLTSMASLAATYWGQGRWDEAEKLEVQVMETRLRVLKVEHPDTLSSMANLALTYRNQGRWDEAEKLQVQVLETRLRVLKVEHPDTLTSMANLASTYWDQGRWDEAEKLEVQVLETMLRVLKAEHSDTLTSMVNLAATYRNQGRWDEAEKLQVQVLETRLRVLKAEHPDTLTSMASLAATYWDQGRWDEAEKLEVQVMETRLRVLKAEHPDTLTSMANLAATYWDQGRWDEAEKLEVQVMETRLRVLKAEHPDTLSSIASLASTYRNQGRWDEAEKLQVQVMETRLRVLKAEHPDTLTSMVNLAAMYRNQGRWDEAEKLQVQVLETRLRVLKAEHPDTLTSMASLAATYWGQERWDEAEKLEVQVMETTLRVLKAEHPDTLSSKANLAATYRIQGRWDEAEKLEVQVMQTRLRVLKAEHPDTLSSMANLAATYRNQGRWDEAEKLQVQVLETRLRVLKAKHPDTLTSMADLAYTYNSQSRHSEAIDLMKKVVDSRTEIIGSNHPDTLDSTDLLREWSGA